MPYLNIRLALTFAAMAVLGCWLLMLIAGVGVATSSAQLNAFITAVGFAVTTFALFQRSSRMSRASFRLIGRIIGFVFGAGAIVAFACVPQKEPNVIGMISTSNGMLVAYRFDTPLVSDSVRIEFQRELFPGLYVFQSKALLDPAWDAHVTVVESSALVVSYTDADGNNHVFRASR